MEAARKREPQAQRYGLTLDDCRLDEFRRLVERTANLADYPNASAIEKNVVIYDSATLEKAASADEEAVLAELCDLLMHGPGVAVFKHAFTDLSVIDRASQVFAEIIDEQHRTKTGGGDHFAKPAPMTASGTRWKSTAWRIPKTSRSTLPTPSSSW